MRRLALALLFSLWSALALAQQAIIAPTVPTAANNDQIANTAWVRNFIASGGVVLISGTGHGDSIYSIASTDRYVYTNAAFTAPRVWTLPAANSLAAGTTIWIQDAQGTVTTTNTLTVSRAGADTIDVVNTTLVITGAGGGITFTTDGVSNWGTPIQTASTGGTGQKTLTNHGVLVGAGLNPITQLAVAANGTVMPGQTGADPAFNAMSGDGTITNAGVLTVTKMNGVDQTTAWTVYTPSPSCGTATFTVNSARSKTMGKTTWVELDTTITAIGTCANTIAFTVPNTANSGGGLAGREIAVNGNIFSCSIPTGTATANCVHPATVALVVNERMVVSGVYENQ